MAKFLPKKGSESPSFSAPLLATGWEDDLALTLAPER
jgi:hypothetical protein